MIDDRVVPSWAVPSATVPSATVPSATVPRAAVRTGSADRRRHRFGDQDDSNVCDQISEPSAL